MVRYFLLLVGLFVALPALAARVQLSVRPHKVQVGQTARLQVVIVGASGVPVPTVSVPDGLTMGHPSQETRTSVTPQGVVTMQTFTYGVMALREGDYTLGPVGLEGLGSTSAVQLRVEPRPAEAALALRAEAGFDLDEAYEGQVIVFSYRLASRVSLAGSPHWRLDAFDGLRPPRDGTRPQVSYAVEDPDGDWEVVERHIPFVVNTTGKLRYGAAVAHVDIPNGKPRRDVFGRVVQPTRREVLPTGSLELTARPLPEPPDGFSGLVGEFRFESEVGKRTLRVGESTTWTVKVQGNGSLEGFELPDLESELLSVYDAGLTVDARVVEGAYSARGSYAKSLVAAQAGSVAPSLEVITFSPAQGRYVTQVVGAPKLTIAAGGAEEQEVTSFGAALLAEPGDEEPYRMRPAWTRGYLLQPYLGSGLPFALGLAFAPAGGISLLIAGRRARRWLSETRAARKQPPRASERLYHLPEAPEARLAVLDAALRVALAQRVGVEVSTLDREQALSTLPEALQQRVLELQQALDRERFGQAAGEDLAEAIRRLVVDMEMP